MARYTLFILAIFYCIWGRSQTWDEIIKVTASDADSNDFFGFSVSISGDRAIVGARTDDDAGFNSGSAYIFHLGGGTWGGEQKITASDAVSTDLFGVSVSISGDRAIVGARNDDDVASNSGSAYLYSDCSLLTVTASADDADICLGESVTLSGEGATTYEWDGDVEDGVTFTPDATGTTIYAVTGTDDNGCVNTATIDVTVYDAIEITYSTDDELYGNDGSIDITVTGGNPAYSFDWDNDGTGDFDDSEDLTDVAGGTYVVVVEDEAGCTATETIVVESQLGINGENGIVFSVYPNPAVNNVTVYYNGTYVYEFVAINGDIILSGQANGQVELSFEGFASGIYFVTVKNNDQISTKKLIIK